MRIVWDEAKRQTNLVKHGLDFADLDNTFFDEAAIRPGHSGRLVAIGWMKGAVAVAFVPFGSEAYSVASMRPASKRERMML